jgi:hypothetical protein
MSDAKLVRYEAACRAIAAARSVDEVKKIRNAAVAMRAYARMARNKEMEADAVEIRMRAKRRLGEMREQQKATIGLATGADASRARVGKQPELCRGVDKYLAHQSRQLGPSMLDEKQFEKVIGEARRAVVRVMARREPSHGVVEAARYGFARRDLQVRHTDDIHATVKSINV